MYLRKKRVSIIICSVLILLLSSININAYGDPVGTAVFSGGYSTANVSSIHYVLSGGDSSYQTNIMAAGANLWNGHHPRVSLSQNNLYARMSIYKGSTATSGLCGIMNPYYWYNGSLVQDTSLTNIWDCTDIYIYDNQCQNFGYTSTANKKSIVCHEVGHAISLAHQKDGQVSIMAQHTGYTVKFAGPQTIDDNNLKLKWGY